MAPFHSFFLLSLLPLKRTVSRKCNWRNWPVVLARRKGWWTMSAGTRENDTDEEAGRGKRNAEREAALAFVRMAGKRTGPDRARRTAQTVHQKACWRRPGRGDDRAPGPPSTRNPGRQGREHAQRHHRQDRGHRFGRSGRDRGAARPDGSFEPVVVRKRQRRLARWTRWCCPCMPGA